MHRRRPAPRCCARSSQCRPRPSCWVNSPDRPSPGAATAAPAFAATPPSGSATRYTIVPCCSRNDGTVNVYQSDDATDFRLLKSSAFTPPSNRIRDASVFKHTDGYYYLTYTTHTWQDVSTTIGFARSSDRANWTFLYDYTVPITNLSRAWAPEWFVDSDGSVNVIVS